MATTDEVIGDALIAIEALRNADHVLAEFEPQIAGIVGVALTLAYEALVAIRSALLTANSEDIRAALAAKAERAIQELAALKFGAMPPQAAP